MKTNHFNYIMKNQSTNASANSRVLIGGHPNNQDQFLFDSLNSVAAVQESQHQQQNSIPTTIDGGHSMSLIKSNMQETLHQAIANFT